MSLGLGTKGEMVAAMPAAARIIAGRDVRILFTSRSSDGLTASLMSSDESQFRDTPKGPGKFTFTKQYLDWSTLDTRGPTRSPHMTNPRAKINISRWDLKTADAS